MFLMRRPMPSLFTPPRGRTENAFADFFQLQDELFKAWNHNQEDDAVPTRKSVLDIIETDTTYVVKANVPGVKTEELDIELDGRVLTFSTTVEAETPSSSDGDEVNDSVDEKEEKVLYLRRDRSQAAFHQSLELPEDLQSDAIEASLEDGVLTLTIPRRAAPTPQKISIQTAKGKAA